MNDEDRALYEEAAKNAEGKYKSPLLKPVRTQSDWNELGDKRTELINEEFKRLVKERKEREEARERERAYEALPESVKEEMRMKTQREFEKFQEDARKSAADDARSAYEAYRENARGRSAEEIPWHNPSAPTVPTTPWDEITSEEDKRIRQQWLDAIKPLDDLDAFYMRERW